MIGRLTGRLLEKQPPHLVLDVQGVGYELEASMNTLLGLPAVGEDCQLFTHLVVREDAQLLYGFGKEPERRLFRELIKISGVGPRLALAILSGMEQADFIRCVHDEDSRALTRLPGVGKKTADRLIIEMRDRLKHWTIPQDDGLSEMARASQPQPPVTHPLADAEAALVALGYKPVEAAKMLSGLETGASTEALIKAALARKMAS
ncbi:Holliday junction branch migration protein RuvA [Cobetia marina]|jgi:Holliday junction DNA helicase RuvA|nr:MULTISPECIES: Holliday junction branch migration protein RuvA [Cobetia]AOM01442.1 Holliday junction DNA helicase RuvA [Cobetia marina]MDA5563450.1 Holliday junction branch migration protein RuvA [Cobetia sp. MMG027]MDH2289683.1 Holliday junction branch migration protein RuvA [Cobetia sp. 10Alg 146]MDH2373769.1 Holliday junction branch migration protein RuvA [Cobetia sp. 3AK]MDI6003465.1 Holliday junction branch migration protein RuvA [Cobetia pacifica]